MSGGKAVLVTGSAGRIGQAVVRELLTRGHNVRGYDLRPTPHVTDYLTGDLSDVAKIRQAMAGIDTLVHLAATPDDADFLSELVPNNIVGVYHVFEAARQAGVRRLILASSGQVVWTQRLTGPWPLGTEVAPTPRYWYAATKLFLEAAGRAFAEAHGMSVLAVRLGWCPRDRGQVEEIRASEWAQDVYLSSGDAGRFYACAVDAAGPERFAVVYATSKPVKTLRYDMEVARSLLGYEPRDTWPEGADEVM